MCVIEGRPTRTVRIIPIGLIDLMAAGCSSNLNTDSEMFCRTDDHEVNSFHSRLSVWPIRRKKDKLNSSDGWLIS